MRPSASASSSAKSARSGASRSAASSARQSFRVVIRALAARPAPATRRRRPASAAGRSARSRPRALRRGPGSRAPAGRAPAAADDCRASCCRRDRPTGCRCRRDGRRVPPATRWSGARRPRTPATSAVGAVVHVRTSTRGGSPAAAWARCSGWTSGPRSIAWITRHGPRYGSRSTHADGGGADAVVERRVGMGAEVRRHRDRAQVHRTPGADPRRPGLGVGGVTGKRRRLGRNRRRDVPHRPHSG